MISARVVACVTLVVPAAMLVAVNRASAADPVSAFRTAHAGKPTLVVAFHPL